MAVRIAGELMYLWRAVDHEGEVLDMLVQRRRGCRAALRLMRKLLKKQGFGPKLLVTDKLRSYSAAFRRLRLTRPHEQELRKTIGLKTLISRCDDASARCSASSRLVLNMHAACTIFQLSTPSRVAVHAPDLPCRGGEPLARGRLRQDEPAACPYLRFARDNLI
jgi:transposase-like protein